MYSLIDVPTIKLRSYFYFKIFVMQSYLTSGRLKYFLDMLKMFSSNLTALILKLYQGRIYRPFCNTQTLKKILKGDRQGALQMVDGSCMSSLCFGSILQQRMLAESMWDWISYFHTRWPGVECELFCEANRGKHLRLVRRYSKKIALRS